jgi:DNA polymerase III subunit epsilon
MLFGNDVEFVALDLETTGLMAAMDRIVEIGAVRFDEAGLERGRFQTLVNPERPMSPGAFAVHGISDLDLIDAPVAADALPQLLAFLGDGARTILLAHNAPFDAGFLGREMTRAGLPLPEHSLCDTLVLARRRLPMLPSHRLDFLTQHLDLDATDAHRALADSLRVKDIWLRLGGPSLWTNGLESFRIFDPEYSQPVPEGWEGLKAAADRGCTVRIQYEGGTQGSTFRQITPRRFMRKGGVTYVVAYCHIDSFEKSFRLDRIRSWTGEW